MIKIQLSRWTAYFRTMPTVRYSQLIIQAHIIIFSEPSPQSPEEVSIRGGVAAPPPLPPPVPPTLASKKKSLLDDSSSSSDNVSFTRANLLIMAFFKSSGIKRLHSYINFSITLIVWFIVVLLSKFITHLNTYGQGEPCLANFAYNI